MINRREFLGIAAGAGATLTLTPKLLRALQQPQGQLIQRAIPSSGEMLPVIGFGRGARPVEAAALKEVLKTLVDNGGKLLDTVHSGAAVEQTTGTAASELGIQNRIFWSTSLPNTPNADADTVKAQVEAKFAALKVPRIDLVMAVGMAKNISTQLAVLREMKNEGRVRYIGVHELVPPPFATDAAYARLESIMRNEQIDFVGTDYAVNWRGVEEKILPLALERKIAFMAYFPFDRARGLQRVGNTPLPEWAAEFDARTWPQFFLKYVLSHPAVVVARTGTTKAEHMLENIGGGIGRLPNEATRKRMAELVDSFPRSQTPGQAPPGPAVVLSAAGLDRQAGEYETQSVQAFDRSQSPRL